MNAIKMMQYDAAEAWRNTMQWWGASAKAMAAYPGMSLLPWPVFRVMGAWGRVMERACARITAVPDWNLDAVVGDDGRAHAVSTEVEMARPFGDLVRFKVGDRAPMARKVVLCAPLSGHYATLLRPTVASLLPDADVWITQWRNAREVPVSAGTFDVEDYTAYLYDFLHHLGPVHVVAVCQPAPLALVATALLARQAPDRAPTSLTLIGGPVDTHAAPTEVTDFGARVTLGQLDASVIQEVGLSQPGAGRAVYPGMVQLAGFMAMNASTHVKAFGEQIAREARGEASDHDRHNRFYDEYLAVLDMPAEFYLSTVGRIFQGNEVGRNAFAFRGVAVDLGWITDTALMVVEGADDDISAPGQCKAALDLCRNIPAKRKAYHLEPGAGHYGIFAGKSWRENIRPLVLAMMDAKPAPKPRPVRKGRRDTPIPTDRTPI